MFEYMDELMNEAKNIFKCRKDRKNECCNVEQYFRRFVKRKIENGFIAA